MINPANNAQIDGGVIFAAFLWEQCKPEMELLTEKDLDSIWKIIVKRTPRPRAWGKEAGTVDPD